MNYKKALKHKVHAKRRAKERLQIKLKNKDIADIKAQIRKKRATLVKTKENIELWLVEIKGRDLIAWYDPQENIIRTITNTKRQHKPMIDGFKVRSL